MVDAPVEGPASFPLAEHPRLGAIEVFPSQDRRRRSLVLRDPADPNVKPIMVSEGAGAVLALLDGQRTLQEVSSALLLRGGTITPGQLRSFLTQLDEAGFLEGPRAEYRFQQRQATFLAQPLRPAIHAGGAYSNAPADLSRMIEGAYGHADGPGSTPAQPEPGAKPLRAAIAPHVDLHRGAPTYSWAYKALAEAQPAEVYVVLGTCHAGVRGDFAATRKAYDTPLGAVPADAEFLDRLGRNWGHDLFAGEFSHAGEHSIEFQAVYLRSLGLAGHGAASIVPILCESLHSMVPDGTSPRDVAAVSQFLAALRQTLAEDGRRTSLIAAVDLAHIGPRFGDQWRVDVARQTMVGVADREMLDLVLEPDADAYYAHVIRDRDTRRICGLTPIYLLTALMQAEQRRGELLRYTQWVDVDKSSSVTFASAIFR
ncbi:MAG: AmmeMemoRadiSam system protein B [Chloroflexota bacterium]|nr:AmmeMemoRadiSam system protein B [Chloroflexota bacterium]